MKLLKEFREKIGRNPTSYEELVGPADLITFLRNCFEMKIYNIAGFLGCTEGEIRRALDHEYNMYLLYEEKMRIMEDTWQITPVVDNARLARMAQNLDMWIGKKSMQLYQLEEWHENEWDRIEKLSIIMQLVHKLKQHPSCKMTPEFEVYYAKIYRKYAALMGRRIKRKCRIDELKFEITWLSALLHHESPSLN